MAKQLYDYWFVQFDFPNEEGKPYKSSGGVMVWNEKLKREIPKQWENCTLSYYVGRITNGLNPRKNFALGDGDNYYVTIRSLLGTDIDWNNCDRCNDEALAKINARSQLQIGDVIFSAIGTIGRTYYIQENPVNWNISETSFTLRANPNIPSELFYSILRSDEVQLQADKKAMGSTLRCLVMDSFLKIPLVKIPTIIGCLFTESIKPIIKQQYLINKENRSLTKQRDELLPLLMNGQASVNSDLSACSNFIIRIPIRICNYPISSWSYLRIVFSRITGNLHCVYQVSHLPEDITAGIPPARASAMANTFERNEGVANWSSIVPNVDFKPPLFSISVLTSFVINVFFQTPRTRTVKVHTKVHKTPAR